MNTYPIVVTLIGGAILQFIVWADSVNHAYVKARMLFPDADTITVR